MMRKSYFLRLIIVFSLIFPTYIPIIASASTEPTDPTFNAPALVDFSNQTWTAGEFDLTGFSIDISATATALVSISLVDAPSGHKLKIAQTAGLVKSFGFTDSFTSFESMSFTGSKDDVNTALLPSSFKYVATNGLKSTSAKIKVSVTENVDGLAYFAKDDHYYKVGNFPSVVNAATGSDQGYFCENSSDAIATYRGITGRPELKPSTQGEPNCRWTVANRLAKSSSLKGRTGY